jgi:membrane protease YdiL (CAAX protease family)
MIDSKGHFRLYNESPLYQLLISVLIISGVGMVLILVFSIAGMFIFDSNFSDLEKVVSGLKDNEIQFTRYLLIVQDLAIFIIPSCIILRLLKSDAETGFEAFTIPQLKEAGLVIILAFCLFPITSFTGEINSAMEFPHWLSGVEKWMVEHEDKANGLLDLLVPSNTVNVMILNLFMIAVLPAFAEEMIFRGIFQRIFSNLFRSGHIAVWITAIIFSAIHFQFFGFIPRFILGLVFGYLFLWSGTLWLPIIAHFVNNAVPVVYTFAQGAEKLNAGTEIPLLKQAAYLPVPLIIIALILAYFRNKSVSLRSS